MVPEMKARPGFVAVRHFLGRSTGRARVGSVWVDQDSLLASLAQSEVRRAAATDRGIEFGDDQVLDVLPIALYCAAPDREAGHLPSALPWVGSFQSTHARPPP